jgi:hypothetical protein
MAGNAPARGHERVVARHREGLPRSTSMRSSLPSGVREVCPLPWGSPPEPPSPRPRRGSRRAEGEAAAVVVRERLAHEEDLALGGGIDGVRGGGEARNSEMCVSPLRSV